MSKSLKKGPNIDQRLLGKLIGLKTDSAPMIKTWSRSAVIVPEMVGFTFGVHNGKDFIAVRVTEEMVGHKLGEFSPTTKFVRHGGKMQKDQEKGAPKAAAPKTAAPKKK